MANETRKIRRAGGRDQTSGKSKKAQLKKPLALQPGDVPDPLGPAQLRATFLRVGLIVGALWLVGALVAGVSTSSTVITVALAVPGVLTVVILGVLVWTLRQAKKARGVASILQGVESAEDRKAALEKLEAGFKKNDPAKVFAKAQLEMQEDPRKALATLEQLDLSKVMAPVADEARTQRAMLHLMLGEVSLARQLADNVDLKRQQDPRSRAMMAAWQVRPPSSVTTAPAFLRAETMSGVVILATMMSPSATLEMSAVPGMKTTLPTADPGEAARPRQRSFLPCATLPDKSECVFSVVCFSFCVMLSVPFRYPCGQTIVRRREDSRRRVHCCCYTSLPIAACAAEIRATGTLNGEQLT